MDVTIAGSSVSQSPTDEQLSRVSIQLVAFDGEVGTGSYPIDDGAGTHDFKGGRAFLVEEDTTVLVDGFLADQDRERGSQPATPHRETVYTVLDPNALLYGFRVQRSRGAETDVARVLAFAATDVAAFDTTWVLNANTSTMTAKTYDTGDGWTDLITDVKELTGKTLWVHDKADGSGRCLHYHRLIDGHTCGLSISDVIGDSDDVTVWKPQNPTRERSPADLINDLKVRDQAGRTFTTSDATSITDHDADGLQHQELMDLEAGSQAELEAKAAQILADFKTERFTYTTTIGPLDADALALIRVGDLMTVTSQVMGLTGAVKRIAHLNLKPVMGQGRGAPSLWMAELELGAPIRTGRRRSSGKKITESPPTSVAGSCLGGGDAISSESMIGVTFEQQQFNNVDVDGCTWGFVGIADRPAQAANAINQPAVGITPAYASIYRHFISHDAPSGADYAILEADVYARRRDDNDDLTTEYAIHQGTWGSAAFPGFDTGFRPLPLRQATINAPWPPNVGGTEEYGPANPVEVTIPVVDGRVQFMFRGKNDLTFDGGDPQDHDVYLVFPGADPNDVDQASYRLTFYEYPGCADSVVAATLISPGTIAHGDGVSDTFITPYPYKSGTLLVFVDGREQEVDETDPESGQFTLPYIPPVDAVIRASFVASSGVPLGAFLADDGAELVPYGSDIQDVAGTEAPGDSRFGAAEDHVHRGVASIRKNGDTLLYGAVTLSSGANVTLTQSGQDISIAASGGGGSAGWATSGTDGVQLDTGRFKVWDEFNDARIELGRSISLMAGVGWDIFATVDVGNYMDFTGAGDGIGLPRTASEPTGHLSGQIYYDTALDAVRWYDGADWHDLSNDSVEGYISSEATISTAAYGDVVSISLPAGEWLITAKIVGRAVNAAFLMHAALTDGSNVVLDEGSQNVPASGTASVNSLGTVGLSRIVTPTGTTTYKLRAARGNAAPTTTWTAVDGAGTNVANNASTGSNLGTGLRAVKIR